MSEHPPREIDEVAPVNAALLLMGFGPRTETFRVLEKKNHALKIGELLNLLTTVRDEEDLEEVFEALNDGMELGFIRQVKIGVFRWNYASKVGYSLHELFYECMNKEREVMGLRRFDGRVEGDFRLKIGEDGRELIIDGSNIEGYEVRPLG